MVADFEKRLADMKRQHEEVNSNNKENVEEMMKQRDAKRQKEIQVRKGKRADGMEKGQWKGDFPNV